jgi:hypothetical protein
MQPNVRRGLTAGLVIVSISTASSLRFGPGAAAEVLLVGLVCVAVAVLVVRHLT